MSHWFSPFPLPEKVVAQLEQAGLRHMTELPVEQHEPVLLLYDTPDRLLATTDLEGSALLDGYGSLLAAPATSPRLAMWRLAALDGEYLDNLLSIDHQPELSADLSAPDPQPLTALVTVAVCRSVPGLLDAYLDLELQALLVGGEPDSAYIRRLQGRISSEGLLEAWRSPTALAQQVADLRDQLVQSNGLLEDNEKALAEANQKLEHQDTSLKEEREAAEVSVLQLHQQVQEEREHYLLADGEKQRQLEAGFRDLEELRRSKAAQESAYESELEAMRQRLEPRVAELEQSLASRETELREAREAAELSVLQLHQVEDELEQSFLKARASDQLAQAQLEAGFRDLEELRRSKAAQESAYESELEAMRQRLELRVAELEQSLASRETELREAREAAELSVLQLHQAEDELEQYFLKARASGQLAQAQLEQLQRAQALMVRLNPDVLPNAPYPPALAVEVLSELPAAMPDSSLQTQAVLSTYAASLQRASALLERARRS
jgi:hypothetical protein